MNTLAEDIKSLMQSYQNPSSAEVQKLHTELMKTLCNNIKSTAVIKASFTGTNGDSTITNAVTLKFSTFTSTTRVPTDFQDWLSDLNKSLHTMQVLTQSGYNPEDCRPLQTTSTLSMSKETDFDSAWANVYKQLSSYITSVTGYTCSCTYGSYHGVLTVQSIKY